MKKKSFLKKHMVFGLAVVLTMTVNLPVYAQETEEMTASVVEVKGANRKKMRIREILLCMKLIRQR